jgi:hypothetical protein
VVNKTGPGAAVEVATLIWKHPIHEARPSFKVLVDADADVDAEADAHAVKLAFQILATFTTPLRR